ncbi:MAG: hypothetical protein J6Y94_08070 [Bacteriovoracaceae bacterium]|nr:hypothetical protein [Bacteriovoracaceae bacterium]
MKKSFLFALGMLLISSMAFGQSSSPRGGNPADLVPFPNAHTGWFSFDLIRSTVEDDEDDVEATTLNFVPSLTYAVNQKIALTFGTKFVTGKEFSVAYGDDGGGDYEIGWGKAKLSGVSFKDLSLGLIWRVLDGTRDNHNNLNLSFNISPAIGKSEIKTDAANNIKVKHLPNKNVLQINAAYSKDIGAAAVGLKFGLAYNGAQKIKFKIPMGEATDKNKATLDFNIGTNVQYRGIDKVALTAGLDYHRYGKLKLKDAEYVYQKAYGQFGLSLGANIQLAKNVYAAANYQHQFETSLKSRGGKYAELSEDLLGIGATIKF